MVAAARTALRSAQLRRLPGVAVALVGAAWLLCGCASSSGGSSITLGNERSTATSSTPATATASGCQPAVAPRPRGPQHLAKPTRRLDTGRTYVVAMQTNCGTIDIQLDVKHAPLTAASFANLVQRRFYDGLTFHRIAAGFVIQGGDPLGTGAGGPGYQVVEKPPAGLRYTPGTVAMAKTAADPDGASGSQFFIVTGTASQLPPQYALVGHVVAGQSAVSAIARIPTSPPEDGAPTSPVVIRRATLSVR